MSLHHLGDRRHLDSAGAALGDHGGGILSDPVDVDLKPGCLHAHTSGTSSPVTRGISPTSLVTQSAKVAATSS